MISHKLGLILFIVGIVTATFLIGEYFTPSIEYGDPVVYQISNVTFKNNRYNYLLFNGERFIAGSDIFEVKQSDILSIHSIRDTLHIPILYEGRIWQITALNGEIIISDEIKYNSVFLIILYIAIFIGLIYPSAKRKFDKNKVKNN